MNNKLKEPNFKTGLFYVLNKNTIEKAIEKKNKYLAIIKRGKVEDKEPFFLKRGNIFPNVNALKSNPNKVLIFDIHQEEELVGSFRGHLYPDKTLSGKVVWRIDLQSGSEKDILNGFYKKYSNDGIELYGFWTDADLTEGFYAELWNAIPSKRK